jgi:probable rRNA maturation factor
MARLVDVLDEAACGVSGQAVGALVRAVLGAEAADGAVTVVFAQEPVIAELNLRYRGLDEPTDVLSFPEESGEGDWPADRMSGEFDSGDGADALKLGEVLVCPAVVGRYAAEEGNDVDRQLAWTIVHGVLHLLGYDHETDTGEMRERERVILAEMAGVGPLLLCVEGD